MKRIFVLLAFVTLLSSCDDMFAPAPEHHNDLEAVKNNPDWAQGLLGYAYAISPFQTKSDSDVATDDAVTNDVGNNYLRMATGGWTSQNDPNSQWEGRRATIQYLNTFLSIVNDVTWAADEGVQQIYVDRMTGDALAMRAINNFYLLRAHGGWTADGELLGFPILTEPETAESDFNIPRATYQECVDMILADVRAAMDLLPMDYVDLTTESQIPQKYQNLGVKNPVNYNRAAGYHFLGRVSGRQAEAIGVMTALMAASPAFSKNGGTTTSWADAADWAASVIDRNGGLSSLAPKGQTWYMNKDDIRPGHIPAELLWTANATAGTEGWNMGLDQEDQHFPPSMYGHGRINPSQNLVDAFPMANGYPITEAAAGYNENDPYAGRDPRLLEYILVNETTYGANNNVIVTGVYGTTVDALNRDASVSTRTGYYLRKLLRDDCNPNPSGRLGQFHYPVRMRFTEMFLAYAEAANEAYGPTATGSHAYSAYDVIKAIRARAGVGASNGDAYLESIKGDKDKMRELIRNERRIELCFENKRFWDLRRWEAPINTTVQGMRIDKQGEVLTYTKFDVERRDYRDHMYYGPIPNGEILQWSNLKQNRGW